MYRNSQGYEVLDENVDQKMIIIGGDMNCQIGEDGDADEDMITGIVHDRTSLEKKSSRRGKDLLCYMDDWGLTVLNGRTPGDIPSQFTYNILILERKGQENILRVVCWTWCFAAVPRCQKLIHLRS